MYPASIAPPLAVRWASEVTAVLDGLPVDEESVILRNTTQFSIEWQGSSSRLTP
jgi:hypothetical protein